jgi:hypothetical protein
MKIRSNCQVMVLAALVCVPLLACGSPSSTGERSASATQTAEAPTSDTSTTQTAEMPASDPGAVQTAEAHASDANALYERVSGALDDAYADLGNPPVDWDNLARVKDVAFDELTADSAETMWGASWSISVLDDHIAVYVNVEGAQQSGEWRPRNPA